ncbi:hypothetical protein LPTSP1_12440 [Leptospira johnsonii]|uniref:Lipoprotein n=1 Tax=Leptospira johnsonii TaxID=1917820 RepID=A0A2P2D0S9_9LEPT|nr:hypothetical protein LPTSP1_12440 [Leptospira johnsonii]
MHGIILREKRENQNPTFRTKLISDFVMSRSEGNSYLLDLNLNSRYGNDHIGKAVSGLSELDLRPDARVLIRYSSFVQPSKEASWFLFFITLGVYPLVETCTGTGTFDFIDKKTGQVVLSKNIKITGVKTFGWFPLLASPVAEIGREVHTGSSFALDKYNLKISPILAKELGSYLSNIDQKDIQKYFHSTETFPLPAIHIGKINGEFVNEIRSAFTEELTKSGFTIITRDPENLKKIVDLQTMENTGLVENPLSIGKLASLRYSLNVDSKIDENYIHLNINVEDLQSGKIIWTDKRKDYYSSRYREGLLSDLAEMSNAAVSSLKLKLLTGKN